MATAQRANGAAQVQEQVIDLDAILKRTMEASPVHKQAESIRKALYNRIDLLEIVLPTGMDKQAPRFIDRALLTFRRNQKMQECTPGSIIQSIVDGAEVGLFIDGRLGHAVPYNVNVGTKQNPKWETHAKFTPDYKGLISVGRRAGQIVDCYGDVVRKNDHFDFGRYGNVSRLEHTYDLSAERGDMIGAYAQIILGRDAGEWRYEVMSAKDIAAIRARSKSKDNGPWVTDTDQMSLKTVMHRAMKLYCDDQSLSRALEFSERQFEFEEPSPAAEAKTVQSLGQLVNPFAGKQQAERRDEQHELGEHLAGSADNSPSSAHADLPDTLKADYATHSNEPSASEQGDPDAGDKLYATFQTAFEAADNLEALKSLEDYVFPGGKSPLDNERQDSVRGLLSAKRRELKAAK